MSKINPKNKGTFRTRSHSNFMGGPSYDLGPVQRLRTMAASSFFGEPMYYKRDKKETKKSDRQNCNYRHFNYLNEVFGSLDSSLSDVRNMSPQDAMVWAIDQALDADIQGTLNIAVELRNDCNIRVTPQVILVRAANHKNSKGSGLIQKYTSKIVKRGDEPATCIAYQLSAFGRTIPNSLKRSLAKVMENYNEYTIGKYRQDKLTVSMKDVARLVHPSNPLFKDLIKGKIKNINTWESTRSSGGSWADSLENMGHMALLRNLRGLLTEGVSPNLFTDKLISGVENGKQLPFRYLSAYKEIEKLGNIKGAGQILGALDKCIEASVSNVPKLSGRSLVLVDNSGSAWGAGPSSMSSMKVAEIGNLMGVITARASEEGVVGVFGDGLEMKTVKSTADILETTKKITQIGQRIGQTTEHGIWLALDKITKESDHYDQIFIYSDMQAGHGGLYGTGNGYRNYVWPGSTTGWPGQVYIDVPKLVKDYRNKVNPNTRVFMVQIAGHEDSIFPETYDNTFILGGWSPNILSYASQMGRVLQNN